MSSSQYDINHMTLPPKIRNKSKRNVHDLDRDDDNSACESL